MAKALTKWANRLVLAWGYLSIVAIVGYFAWAWISFKQWERQEEQKPSLIGIDDLAKDPDFRNYTSTVARLTGDAPDQETLIAGYFFRSKVAVRRHLDWRRLEDFIRQREKHGHPMTEQEVIDLLGPPDKVRETNRALQYTIADFREGGHGISIETENGKVVRICPTGWVQ